MPGKKVLISGAGIAGPALAYWLSRYGYDVTVVERAPSLRGGGQAVDFKGRAHRTVLEKMGIWDEVHLRRTGKTDLRIVDEHDRPRATIPAEFTGGDVEILRGDLGTLLHERTADTCAYVFGDHITAMDETPSGVDVTFACRPPETFDLVFGADGLHSAVRHHAFGPEDRFVRFLGYYYAVAGGSPGLPVPGPPPAERSVELMYNEPGRLAVYGGPKTPLMFVFASRELDYDRHDVGRQKRMLADAYAGSGWRVPEMIAALDDEPEFYLDSISRVHMRTYTSGRAALVGDSAYGNVLGGFGTGLAVVGAYVLAGELAAAGGDHRTAFARYDETMYGYAKIARSGNAGRFLAPASRLRIRMRDRTFSNPFLLRMMMKLTDGYATGVDLRDYPAPTTTP
ncbi:FAD-dependent oxidoreductase [Planotetraspora thailandica]|uniref:FAD-dependent oxidoreductase n=1 Tax=Planotetraspora thailandica TaxID=487172 RepID=A0A8J3V7Y3_9ACTN|nr:FAD-dependent monooxygenase [Planotetraspora thailandica]GII57700.1 FAD-dependent oxidoreductase [Planotetraspora thailandica]